VFGCGGVGLRVMEPMYQDYRDLLFLLKFIRPARFRTFSPLRLFLPSPLPRYRVNLRIWVETLACRVAMACGSVCCWAFLPLALGLAV
jgi:hypothetical protein